MKKEKRLIKINDNFSAIEIYLDDSESYGPHDLPALIIVSSRTFSGRYTCRFNREEIIRFSAESLAWLKKLTSETDSPVEEILSFTALEDALILEVRSLSSTKVSWTVTCKPFLPDIEVLQVRLDTEANLVRAVSSWSDKI